MEQTSQLLETILRIDPQFNPSLLLSLTQLRARVLGYVDGSLGQRIYDRWKELGAPPLFIYKGGPVYYYSLEEGLSQQAVDYLFEGTTELTSERRNVFVHYHMETWVEGSFEAGDHLIAQLNYMAQLPYGLLDYQLNDDIFTGNRDSYRLRLPIQPPQLYPALIFSRMPEEIKHLIVSFSEPFDARNLRGLLQTSDLYSLQEAINLFPDLVRSLPEILEQRRDIIESIPPYVVDLFDQLQSIGNATVTYMTTEGSLSTYTMRAPESREALVVGEKIVRYYNRDLVTQLNYLGQSMTLGYFPLQDNSKTFQLEDSEIAITFRV